MQILTVMIIAVYNAMIRIWQIGCIKTTQYIGCGDNNILIGFGLPSIWGIHDAFQHDKHGVFVW